MPWQDLSPLNRRMRVVTEWQSGCWTMTDLCADYQISRKTGYTWIDRFALNGPRGLHDQSRRPHDSPRATDPALVETLVAPARRRVPAAHTLSPLAPITRVNEVWTTDFKGECRTGDGVYGYPLTLRDGWSRFVWRCDNGGSFASTSVARLSRLSVWWMRLGIVPERIAPGHPAQNGSHEQFHSVLKAETARPPAAHAGAQQRRFARFCVEYNQERPHEALRTAVPAHLPALEYPGHCETRRVSTVGTVSWRNRPLFLSEALAGEYVAFEEVDDGIWTLRFATVALARYDARHRSLHPLASLSSAGRSASSAGSAPVMTNKANAQ